MKHHNSKRTTPPNEVEAEAIHRLHKFGAASIRFPRGFSMQYARVRVERVLRGAGLRKVVGVSVIGNSVVMWNKLHMGKGKADVQVQEVAFSPEASVVASVFTRKMIREWAYRCTPTAYEVEEMESEIGVADATSKMLRYLEEKLKSGRLSRERYEELRRQISGNVHQMDSATQQENLSKGEKQC